MELNWSLKELYSSFDSKEFKDDFEHFKLEIKKRNDWANENLLDSSDACKKIETYISMQNTFAKFDNLIEFCALSLSTDTKNKDAVKNMEVLEELYTDLTKPNFLFEQFVYSCKNLEQLISNSSVLTNHKFYLMEIKENGKYLLSEQEEVVISKLINTGSNSWGKLREHLSSLLKVKMTIENKEKELPISLVRNYAYDENSELRKSAYEAELASYGQIDDSVAFSLNSIKGEVITMSKLRGYPSPLDMTLINARMDRETLDALLGAIKESLPIFTPFFKHKAKLLGHENGLPFYDLFAPVGKLSMTFNYEEAACYVVDQFKKFSEKLGDFAQRAFSNNWIDVEPKQGKRGGAFCSNIHSIGESRILTNFTGSFSDVLTLAHELGHGYHGDCLKDEDYLNSHYSMPIAETASTFCETIVTKAALKTATKEEALVILENDLTGSSQVVVDIYSRFLFEDRVFKERENGSLTVDELNDVMLQAQKESYLDGLDHNFLHPYMWLIKPHYYEASTNYYNFPYAYGLLLTKGLYSIYLEQGDEFVKKYDDFLAMTGKSNLRDVAKIFGIDTRDINFWKKSLKVIEDEINEFVKL